jgi:hypothetical protein
LHCQAAATTLLDKVVARTVDADKETFKKEEELWGSTVMSDGLTDKRKHPLLNVIKTVPTVAILTDLVDASGHTKDTDYIIDILAPHINENVDLVTMDGANAAALTKLETEYPWLSGVVCGTHSIALIFGDIGDFKKLGDDDTKWFAELFKQAVHITKFFRSHQATAAILRKHSTKTLLQPAETRFGGRYVDRQ